MWILAHEDELTRLPEEPFLYEEVDLSFSIFRQAVERGILVQVDEASTGVAVWELNVDFIEEKAAGEL
jgi:hypothetical protein